MELLPFMYDLSGGPFMEACFGVENIFKVMRVDADAPPDLSGPPERQDPGPYV